MGFRFIPKTHKNWDMYFCLFYIFIYIQFIIHYIFIVCYVLITKDKLIFDLLYKYWCAQYFLLISHYETWKLLICQLMPVLYCYLYFNNACLFIFVFYKNLLKQECFYQCNSSTCILNLLSTAYFSIIINTTLACVLLSAYITLALLNAHDMLYWHILIV